MVLLIRLTLLLIAAASAQAFKNNLPKFAFGGVSELVVTVKEGPESLGKPLYLLRGEDVDGDTLTFGALGPDGKELLRFERKSKTEAEVFLNKELDREVRDSYTIVLTLTDGKLGDGQFIHQTLVIIVEDINDNEPVFKAYKTSHILPEGARPQLVDTLEATDRDQGPFGQVVYQFQNTDAETLATFKLQQQGSQARISLIGELDYERKFVYELRVLAIDRARQGPRHTATAVVIIKVEDLEDQPPVFTQVPAITRVAEDVPVGSSVLTVKAQDGDRGINNQIKYRIKSGNLQGLFSINDDTGVVRTSGKLDRESTEYRNGAFILQIEASEVGSAIADSVARTEVTIVITDVNDETPTFRSPLYFAEIIENAQINAPITFLGNATPEVFDHDQGTNGTFSLFLDDPQGTFEVFPAEVVNEASFVIRVRRPQLIDFEETKVIKFNVVAKEVSGINPKTSSAEVTVYVRDANDNFPQFMEETYRARVREDAQVGTVIAKVQAIDRDSELFGTEGIRYTSIRGPMADKLRLEPISGEVVVATNNHGFDRETVSSFSVTIEARDELGKGSRNTVQLEVTVDDVNDVAPLFDLPIYEARLRENDPQFNNPMTVHATDGDQPNTPNSAVRYVLMDHTRNFTINESTGEIKPKNTIDFESIPQQKGDIRVIVLTVMATDAGQPPLSTNTTVKVFVQDANDNAPIFKQNFYHQAIPEDIREGSSIVRVEATDADDSPAFSKIAYRIETGAQDKFVIDATSGVISVAPGAYLDPDRTYPKSKVHTLTIVALDGGLGDQQMWAACQVNISIVDVNNKPPTLRPPGIVHIIENTPSGTEVGQLVATDPDDNPDLSYSLCSGEDALSSEAKNEEGTVVPFNAADAFRVDLKSGRIFLRQSLDRETVETIKMCVQVVDEAGITKDQLSQAILNVKIGDVNDNAPVFRKPFYREAVTENSKIGSPVVTARAMDVDKNRTITYSLEGPSDLLRLISIDRKTGEVLVSDKIDRETTSWINVTLKATDSGFPPLTGMTSLSIQVLDENDNNPVFADGPTEFHVSEDSAVGTVVAQLTATDADAGEHGRITYALDPTGTHGKFKIDKDTGVISVAAALDREDISQFTLIVQAWDNYEAGVGTDQSRRSFKQITIHLSDVNDEKPVFVKQLSGDCASVSEFLNPGETVLTISATDKDEPGSLNSRLVFSMDIDQPENEIFEVETLADNQARLFTKVPIRGKVGNYSLTLRARDQGFPIQNSMEKFNVCVFDVNDHAPVFIKPPQNYTIRIPENATIGTVVVEALADDEDHGPNAMVKYRLKTLANNHWRTFGIDENTGVITLRAALDRETQKVYELRVEARDLGSPTQLTSDLDLTIYVTDVNDYAPEFTQDVFQLTFTENMTPGQEMYKLLATVDRDDDFGQNKPIPCYYIVGGNEENRFSLDIFTHQLVTTEVLDREEKAHYALVVQASDDCFHQPKTVTSFDSKDNSLLQVDVKVLDVNDNPPRFVSRVFTGGVTTEATFGTTFMKIQAVDIDQGENSKVSYYIDGEVVRTLTEGLDPIQGSPFLLDRRTGDIALNFYPQRGMKGYFDFKVVANDSEGLSDTANVYIYLLREDQRVRFVLRLTPDEFKEKEREFRMVMANITGAIVNIDDIKLHENPDGTVDRTKSDIYSHFVNREDNTIMEVMTAISLIDQNSFFLDKLFKDFNVLHSEPAEASIVRIEEDDPFKTWLVGLVVFLAVMLVLVLSLCVAQKQRYQRQLKAATVSAFGSSNNSMAHRRHDLPNTNQHSVEGSNPIWMHSYDNEWFNKEDEELRHSDSNSLDENAVADNTDQGSGSGSDGYSTSNLMNERYVISPQSRSQARTLQKSQQQKVPAPKPPPPPPQRNHNRNNFNTVLDVGVDYSHIFNAKMGTPNRFGKLEVSEL